MQTMAQVKKVSSPKELLEDKAPLSGESEASNQDSTLSKDKKNGRVQVEEGVPLKRPKGKVFQCTGYPGCSMVFTRSEHLARHIRKHTGERPFQCNLCMKKFSRLDNLRQHKQTVHHHQLQHQNFSHSDLKLSLIHI